MTDISIACRTFCSENRLGEMFWILTELKQLLYYIWIECSDYSSTIVIIVIRVCKIVQKYSVREILLMFKVICVALINSLELKEKIAYILII